MKAVNEGSMLVAKSLDILKGYKKAIDEHEVWEIVPVDEAIKLLELALEKLVENI